MHAKLMIPPSSWLNGFHAVQRCDVMKPVLKITRRGRLNYDSIYDPMYVYPS